MDTLVNRVANSGLKTINLEDFFPKHEIVVFDIKDYLYMDLILKEKDFRKTLKEMDWSVYQDKIVTVHCSTDAIIPMWAYMLVSTYLKPIAHEVYAGSKESYLQYYYQHFIATLDVGPYAEERVIIKGCGKLDVPHTAYAALTSRLVGVAQSIMYGEPCSTVPIHKRPRKL